MSGEYIIAKTIDEYWSQLKSIYVRRSSDWKDLTEDGYKKIERSEREDSDNHFNMERLGKETEVIDLCHYKFLPDRLAAYHIEILHKDKTKKDVFFMIKLKEDID
jgi:hypothetical protein